MTYITEPGVKPTTMQNDFEKVPFDGLSGWCGDVFDVDIKFEKRDCQKHGPVIDISTSDEIGGGYKLWMTFPESESWRNHFLTTFVSLTLLWDATSGDSPQMTVAEWAANNIRLTFLEGIWKEGVLMRSIGHEWHEKQPGEWIVRKSEPQQQEGK